jgi:hypothetical protein
MRTRGHRADLLVVVVFLAILWLPLADSLFSLDPAQKTTENRELAHFPSFSISFSYIKELWRSARHYGDFFGFRNSIVRWHNRLELDLWGKKLLIGQVVRGNAGWLYLGWPEALVTWRNADLCTDTDLATFKTTLEERRDWLLGQGIQFLFVVVPDKETIYPEFYPEGFEKLASKSRLDQLVSFLNRESDVHVLDLRGALLGTKGIGQLYYRTDTHWNDLGALVGTREIALALATALPSISIPRLDDYEPEKSTYAGDLARMLSLSDIFREDVFRLRRLVPISAIVSREGLGTNPQDGFLFAVDREDASGLPRAVVVGDSFAEGLAQFASVCFGRAVFVYSPTFEAFAAQLVAQEKPDVVVHLIVERNLRQTQARGTAS